MPNRITLSVEAAQAIRHVARPCGGRPLGRLHVRSAATLPS